MKQKATDRQRTSQTRYGAISVSAATLVFAFSAQAQTDAILPPIGGGGGGQFVARCPTAELLTGFELRTGDDVDAIAPICIPAGVGQFHTYPLMFGGGGGGPRQLVCPNDAPVVTGMFVGAEGVTIVVNNIHLFCGPASPAQPHSPYPAAVFDAPAIPVQWVNGIIDKAHVGRLQDTQRCPAGLVGVGITGRSGVWLDAVGLICAPPQIAIDAAAAAAPRPPVPPPPRPVVMKPPTSERVSAEHKYSATSALPGRSAETITAAMASQAHVDVTAAGGGSPTAAQANPAARPASHPTAPATLPTVDATSSPPAVPAPPPATPASVPPLGKPPGSDSDAPSSRDARDAAVAALIGTIASAIGESRRSGHHDANRRDGLGTTADEQAADAREPMQPENSIRVEVRYPIAYGYRDAAGVPDPNPNSCGAFYISTFPISGVRLREPAQIDTATSMRSSNGAYICEYLISGLALGQPVAVRVAMSDQRAAGSEVWLGGSQAQPPAGRRRTIVEGDRQVVLTAERSRASLSFEMTYAGGSP